LVAIARAKEKKQFPSQKASSGLPASGFKQIIYTLIEKYINLKARRDNLSWPCRFIYIAALKLEREADVEGVI
jgi:hypothetical protein